MEKPTNYFVISPIFKNQELFNELISRAQSKDEKSIWNQYYILVIGPDGMDDQLVGADQLGPEVARIFSSFEFLLVVHQTIEMKVRFETDIERIKKVIHLFIEQKNNLETDLEKIKNKLDVRISKKKRENYQRRQRRKARKTKK